MRNTQKNKRLHPKRNSHIYDTKQNKNNLHTNKKGTPTYEKNTDEKKHTFRRKQTHMHTKHDPYTRTKTKKHMHTN